MCVFHLNRRDRQPVNQHLVKSLRRRHRSLDSKTSNVLPSLLEQRDKIVDSQHDVSNQLILSHIDVSNSNTQAQHLLQLELDRALDLSDLVVEVFSVGDWGWELSGLGETGSEETGDLLDEGI